MSQLILYTSEDGKSQLRAEGGTVWLSQLEMAELFQTSKQNVAKHLKSIFADQELSEESVVNQWLTTDSSKQNFCTACSAARPQPWADDRSATRRVANSIVTGRKASIRESSAVRVGWGALS